MSATFTATLRSITCLNESSEASDSDEPYVLVTAVDLGPLVPQVEVTLYGPFSDVDAGETHGTIAIPANLPPEVREIFLQIPLVRRPFWSLDNDHAGLVNTPGQVIFIVSVMENDDGHPSALRTVVKGAAVASLAASVGFTRALRVSKLIADINGALGIPTGAPDFDDPVGTHELVLTKTDLVPPASLKRTKTLKFGNDSEGIFRTNIELKYKKA
jgi:hypothetical protein